MGEVESVIKRISNNKALGEDGVNIELINVGGKLLITVMHRLIIRMWKTETMPHRRKTGIISPFYKEEDKLLCENYRGIYLEIEGSQ